VATTVDCPTCGRKAEFSPANRWRPFCSQRCKLIDLGAWATDRYTIPGGTCEFDLPSYHAWLTRDAGARSQDLRAWLAPLMQFHAALAIVLKLLRETAHRSRQVAAQGAFQQMLQGRTYALLQVRLDASLQAIPEISANKYMLWIRFTLQDRDLKPRPADRDVPFELALCAF